MVSVAPLWAIWKAAPSGGRTRRGTAIGATEATGTETGNTGSRAAIPLIVAREEKGTTSRDGPDSIADQPGRGRREEDTNVGGQKERRRKVKKREDERLDGIAMETRKDVEAIAAESMYGKSSSISLSTNQTTVCYCPNKQF